MKKRAKQLSMLASKIVASGSLLTAISTAMAATTPFDKLQPAPSLKLTEAMVKEVVEARKKFGFRHDEEYVRELLSRPENFDAVFGPLTGNHYVTPEEVKELEVRLQVQDDAVKMMRNARLSRDFAGMYVDQKGNLHVGYTHSLKERMAGLQKSTRHPERVRTFKAKYSLAELESKKDQLVKASDELVNQGIEVSKVAVDVKTNLVTVSVVDLDPAKRKAIASRFGEVDIIEGEVLDLDSRSATADPMRAGVRITNASGGSCTSNWKARDRDDGTLVMITAGHCAPSANGTLGTGSFSFNQGVTSTSAPRRVGTSDQTTWLFPTITSTGARRGAAPVDAIRVPFDSGIGSLPWLYAYDNANAGVFSDGEEAPVGGASGSVVVGTSVCSSGQFSPGQSVGGNFKNCGTVSQVNVAQVFARCSGCSDRFTLQNANIADYVAIPGDSGSPVWRLASDGSGGFEAIAVGHHTGGPTGAEVFNDVDRVENALNVDIVHF